MLNFENAGRCGLSTSFRHGSTLTAMMIGGASLFVVGCGGGGTPAKVQQAETTPATKAAPKSERPQGDEHADKSTTRRKESSGIPYDAFFDDPLEVAQNAAAAPGAAVAANEGGKPEEKPMAAAPPAAAAGGALAWSEFITVDSVQDEIKKIRNRLTASLAQVGTYNGNYKEIAVDGAVIAALAGIVIEHGGDVPWKAKAPYIRNFGFELSQAATGLGKDNYEKSKTAFDKLTASFNGEAPADAGAVAAKRPFSEVADRGGLMKRIEKAKNWMRDNINNDAKLKGEADAILHEAVMISTLGKVVSLEGYTNTDEQDYQQFVNALIGGAQEAQSAVKDQSLKKFTDSMNKVSKSCDQCHANYGNG